MLLCVAFPYSMLRLHTTAALHSVSLRNNDRPRLFTAVRLESTLTCTECKDILWTKAMKCPEMALLHGKVKKTKLLKF